MTTFSFAPKLTEREATVLAGFGNELQGAISRVAEELACRGLLQRGQKVEQQLGGMTPVEVYDEIGRRYLSHDYRITKRGELMLQRYQRQVVSS